MEIFGQLIIYQKFELEVKKSGLNRDLNPGPLAP